MKCSAAPSNLKNISLHHLAVEFNNELDCLVYERKLKPGAGPCNYGLEVCKSLKLPETFLEMANEIRLKQFPKEMNVSSNGKTYYNRNKMKSNCEICSDEIGIDTHHLLHQKHFFVNAIRGVHRYKVINHKKTLRVLIILIL